MVIQKLAGRTEDIASIKQLLTKSRWTAEEYQALKGFLRITREEEEEVLSKVDIEGLLAGLGHYFPTQQAHPQIKCFLHPDDTPSLTLYRINTKSKFPNSCYCFGCHLSLNPIKVMVQLYGYSYPEAMDYLLGACLGSPQQLLRREIVARFKSQSQSQSQTHRNREDKEDKLRARPLAIPPLPLPPVQDPIKTAVKEMESEDAIQTLDKTSLLPQDLRVQAVLEATVNFYHLQLKTNQGGLDYLYTRGLSARTIEEARLGYSSGQGLAHWLKEHNLDLDIAREIGLLYHDRKECLAGRIVLPSQRAIPSNNQAQRIDFLTGRLLLNSPVGAGSASKTFSFQGVSTREKNSTYQPKYLSVKMTRPTASVLEDFLTELRASGYPRPNTFCPTLDEVGLRYSYNLIQPYLLLVEGPFDNLLAQQWGYQAICCYGTSLCYQTKNMLKAALDNGLLQRLFICFDADPSKEGLDGTLNQGAGPTAAAALLEFLDTPKAQLLPLPTGFKDIASLGEVENGRTFLTEAFEEVTFSLPQPGFLKGGDLMPTTRTREISNRPEPTDLISALRIVTGELKQIANLRYIDRLDYHQIYEALEVGQAALDWAEAGKTLKLQLPE